MEMSLENTPANSDEMTCIHCRKECDFRVI